MSIERSIAVKNRLGVTTFTIDGDDGIRDNVGNALIATHDRVNAPLLAGSINSFIWVCQEGVWVVSGVAEAHTVVGGSGATVTVVVCPGAIAIASGVVQLTAPLDLTVTAPAKSFGTLIASPTEIYRGDAVALLLAGTLTGLVGALSIQIKKIK